MSDPTTATPPAPPARTTLAARNAVALTFFLNGLLFATWISRIPEARRSLGLDNGQLGLLLLAIAAGSLLSMPTSGALISRLGSTLVVRAAGLSALVGLVLAAVAVGVGSVPLAAVGLFAYGIGTGV